MTTTPATSAPSTTNGAQTNSSTSNSSSSSSATSSNQLIGGNLNTFLTLLTTQLQNQDPLSPLDANQFTQELVQFAGVEQQMNTNTNLNSLISLQQGSQAASALSYIGSTVQASGNAVPLVNGQAQIAYTLPSQAATAMITISNSAGTVVDTINGPTSPTQNVVNWNGTDSQGNQLPDGVYNFAVTAVDSSNKSITATPSFYGQVTGVNGTGSSLTLDVDGQNVPLANILSVTATGASANGSSASSGSSGS